MVIYKMVSDVLSNDVWKRTIRNILILGLFGVVYYFVARFTDFGIKCYVYELTGLKCPTCGATRMAIALSKLDFKSAFRYNGFILVSLPFIIGEIMYLFYVNEAKVKVNKKNAVVMYVWVGLLVIFGIVRNIFGF